MAEALATARVDLVANTVAFVQGIKEAKTYWDRFGDEMEKTRHLIEATLAFQIGSKLFDGIKQLTSAIGELAEEGEKAGSIEEAFAKLGGSVTQIDKAKNAVMGMVGSTELMQIANAGLLKQIPGFNENFGKIAELGARMANTLGVDTKDAINAVSDAIASGNVKQLQAVGITVNLADAYKKYAAASGLAADKLDKQQKIEAVQLASMGSLTAAIERQAEVTDSVANAQQAFKVAQQEAVETMGKALNSNEDLTKAWREFTRALDDVNWKQLGETLAKIEAVFVRWATTVLPAVEREITLIVRGFDKLFGDSAQAKLDRLSDKIKDLEKQLEVANRRAEMSSDPWYENDAKRLEGEHAAASAEFKKLKEELDKATEAHEAFNRKIDEGTGVIIRHGAKGVEQLRLEQNEADKAKKEFEKLGQAWQKTVDSFEQDELKTAIGKSIDNLDTVSFDGLKKQLAKQIEDAFVEGQRAAIESGAVKEADVRAIARRKAEIEAQEYDDKMGDAMRQSVDDWADLFEQAIDGTSANLADSLKKIAVGFAAQFAAELSGSTGGSIANGGKGLGGAGAMMAKGIYDYFLGASTPTPNEFGGVGSAPYGPAAPGEAGGGFNAASAAGYFQGAMATFGAFQSKNDLNEETKSHAGDGAAYGSAAGGILGAIFGGGFGAGIGSQLGGGIGQMIGGLFGLGHSNPDTIAREAFGKFIEETLQKLGQVSYFNSQGKLTNVSGEDFMFEMGSAKRFNDGDWADRLNESAKLNKNTFKGLGEALEEVLGLEEDVGAQMALMMTEKFGGSVDSARLLVMQLGVSLEDLTAKLVEAGRTGEMTWHEVEVNLQGVSEAFKPGLEAFGDVAGAFQELEDSGGRGVAALKGVKDLAVETMEAGGKTLDDLKNKMLAGGIDPEKVNATMQAISQRNVKTLEELANVSDRIGGGIVADIESASGKMAETWTEMSKQLEDVAEKMEALPKEIESNVTINVKSNVDENAEKILEMTNTDLGLDPATESERMLTRSTSVGANYRRSGGASVGARAYAGDSGNTIVINAPNAGPGVEERIRTTVRDMETRIVSRATRVMKENAMRTGR